MAAHVLIGLDRLAFPQRCSEARLAGWVARALLVERTTESGFNYFSPRSRLLLKASIPPICYISNNVIMDP